MQTLGLGGLAAPFIVGGMPMRAFAQHPMVSGTPLEASDRVLVLIQLKGGNDGLNTIVPFRQDVYYRKRPTIAIPRTDVLPLTADLGLHPSLKPMHRLWDQGKISIVQGVGYQDQSLSHFRSTDIWNSGSDSDEVWRTGWAGRAFTQQAGDLQPDYPLAVQLGLSSSLMLRGPDGPLGMNITDNATLERLARGGNVYDASDVPATRYGDELAFARSIANDAYLYGGVVHEALNAGTNALEYPDTSLSRGMANIARMIKGGLQTKLYLVTISGFDTHVQQANRHAALLDELAGAMAAFQADLEASSDAQRVLTMTFSEFGRRVEENGSQGTDHGAAAPLFLMGRGVDGRIFGDTPSLHTLDDRGNQPFTNDFRGVYASVLRNWLGFESDLVSDALGNRFEEFNFIQESALQAENGALQEAVLAPAFPNPFNVSTRIRFELAESAPVRIAVYDATGRQVAVLLDETKSPGWHQVRFYGDQLASGVYFCELTTGSTRQVQQVTFLK